MTPEPEPAPDSNIDLDLDLDLELAPDSNLDLDLDPDAVGAFAFRVWGFRQGEVVALMIHLGDRLGLYRALAGAGPVTAGVLAERYPRSHFDGYDLSRHAVQRAREAVQAAGLTNVALHHARAEDVPAGAGYDLVLALDCLHDMTHPAKALAAIRAAVADDGTLLVKEIKSSGDWQRDQRNPMLAMLYGFSVQTCLSSALSEPGGAGLGTLGLPPDALRALCEAAGFTRMTTHDVDDPANLYHEVRP